MAQGTFTLVAEAVQGQVGPVTRPVPSGSPARVQIVMVSTVFPSDPSLSFDVMVEESFDAGSTWMPASGFPAGTSGGTAGQPVKGGVSSGLFGVEYAFDGRARVLRITATPRRDGVVAAFDWGLNAILT
jgi:hypothetical protein